MLEKVKYDVGTKVRAKIHYLNDPRSEVEAVICGIEIDGKKNKIKYKIDIPPTEEDRMYWKYRICRSRRYTKFVPIKLTFHEIWDREFYPIKNIIKLYFYSVADFEQFCQVRLCFHICLNLHK